MRFDQRRQIALDDEILALVHERLDRARNSLARAIDDLPPALAGEIRILFRARQRELLLDDLSRQDEPGIIVAGLHDVFERRERIEAGIKRHRQSFAARVEPERRRSGQNADGVVGPDRIPVLDAFDVVPHAVAVDDGAAGGFGDRQHAAVDMIGHAGDHPLRRAGQDAAASSAAPGRDWRRCRRSETMTACAFSSKAPTISRELFRPRSTSLGAKNVAAHAVDRRARFASVR